MQQLLLNVEESYLETLLRLLRTLNYVQVVRPESAAPVRWAAVNGSPQPEPQNHFLSDLAGSLAGPDGDELAEILNREFQEIEGEW